MDILILFLTMLVLANYRVKRSILYPPFAFCAMWLLDVLIYRFRLVEVDSLHAKTLYIVAAGALLFSLGGRFALLVPTSIIAIRFTFVGHPKTVGKWLKPLIVIALTVCVGLAIREMVSLAAGAPGMNLLFFAVARNEIVENLNQGRGSNTLYTFVWGWTIIVAALFLSEYKDRYFWMAAVLAFAGCVLSGARGGFLFLFSALTSIYLIKARREGFLDALRVVRWPLFGFLFLFMGMLFIDKSVDSGSKSAIEFAGKHLVEYIIGPTAALDYVLQHPQDYANLPHHTFRLFLRITSTSGLMSYHPPPALDAFIFVPFGTNVYTVYKFFITDFGVNAAVIILGILGFLHTLLFRKAHSQSVLGVFLFSLTMFPVLMVIFDDQYSQFGLYIEAVVFAVSYFTIKSFPWKVFRSRATNGYGLRQEV